MSTARRRGMLAVVTAIVLLALGLGVGVVVGDALGIRPRPSTQMTPADPVVPEIAARRPAPRFGAIDAPDTPRVTLALHELTDAAADAATSRAKPPSPSRRGRATTPTTRTP